MPFPDQTVENEQERKRRELLNKVRAHWGPELYELAKVENQEWYMGMLGRNDIAPYLQKVGDYAVRAADKFNFCELVLSVRSTTQIHHITLACDPVSKGWTLTPQRLGAADCHIFQTICDLIDFYKTNDLPLSPPNHNVRLVQHCKRPRWILKRSALTFDANKLLGSGNFCDVYSGKLNKRRVVAIKICRSSEKENKKPEDHEKEFNAREALIKEGQLMSTIRHKNIITFYGICFDKPPVMIAMELCPGGSLQSHLQKFKDKITIGERLKFAQETSEGMAHLHEKGLIHRDLAARNCLISKFGVCKIADFGLTKLVSELTGEMTTKEKVPLRWMAPECISKKPQYSVKSDVWSFGVLLYEIFSNGEKPWPHWDAKKISHYIRHGLMLDMPASAPDPVRELVQTRCWAFDVNKRCDFAFIIESLARIAPIFPCPKASELTVNETPGVRALPPEDIQMALDASEEDIAIEAVASVMGDVHDPFKKLSAADAHAVEREVTIEEAPPSDRQQQPQIPGVIMSGGPPQQQQPRRTPSRRRKSAAGRNNGTKQSMDYARGLSQEHTSGTDDKPQQQQQPPPQQQQQQVAAMRKSYKRVRSKATASAELTATTLTPSPGTPGTPVTTTPAALQPFPRGRPTNDGKK